MPLDMNDFNTASGGRWLKLRDAGDKITGELIDIDKMTRTDPSGEIVYGKKSGKPRYIFRVRIQTEPEGPDDDGIRIFDANESAQRAILDSHARDGQWVAPGTVAIAVTAAPPSAFEQATYAAKFKPGKPGKLAAKPAAVNVDELI